VRAAVFAGEGEVEVRDVPEPQIAADDDVIVRVDACGICGSDLRALAVPPTMTFVQGVTMGHEFVGEVVEAGPRARPYMGARVVAVPNVHCGRCASCRRERPGHCESFEHVGATRDGAFAERCLVPAELLHQVPHGLDTRLAALAEPLACVLNGTRRAGWHPGTPTLILGAGPIGLLFTIVARLAGADPVIVSEPARSRREQARAAGASLVIDPTAEPLVAEVRDATGGLGVEVVVDAVGTLLPDALESLRKGGLALIFGLAAGATVEIEPSRIVERELRVEGVYITKGTFPLALDLLAQRGDLFAPLISEVLPLERIADGVQAMRSGAAVKVLIEPNALSA
jgi:threonine dehydrogenase-like Zn-dependent dehydrogenase